MKKYFIIIIVVLVILAGGVWLLWPRPSMQPVTTGTGTSPFGEPSTTNVQPNQHSTTGSISITASDGSALTVKDFTKDTDTYADPSNPGQYYLGYHPFDTPSGAAQPNSPYYIDYISQTGYFGVLLNQEPIAQARQAAEQYLMQKLGLDQNQMCKLSYMVSTPYSVNQYYAGVSLGFSFCPGAVQLAQ